MTLIVAVVCVLILAVILWASGQIFDSAVCKINGYQYAVNGYCCSHLPDGTVQIISIKDLIR